MAVVKKLGTPVRRLAAPVSRRRAPSTEKVDLSTLELPTESKGISNDLGEYITLIYGAAGIGKTTLIAGYPDALFFAFEPGLKALDAPEFFEQNHIQPSWGAFRRGVDLLVSIPPSQRKYKTVGIDTTDRAYELAMKWVCEELNIAFISEDDKGKTDRSGKGWTTLRHEFTDQFYRLSHAGYGICLTSHSKTKEIETHSGAAYDVIVPTMSGQALDIMRSITDFIFYAEYVRDSKGKTVRILITTGDELVTAKHRTAVDRPPMPRYLELPDPTVLGKDSGYQMIRKAFIGDYAGLDAGTFLPSKQTSKVGGRSIIEQKMKGEQDQRHVRTLKVLKKK